MSGKSTQQFPEDWAVTRRMSQGLLEHINDGVYHLVNCDEGGDWVEIHDSGPPSRQYRWLPHAL